MRGGYRVPGHLRRLCIDLAEMAFGEFSHPKIVLRVCHDLINASFPETVRQVIGRVETLPFVRCQIEPEDVLRPDALRPYLAINVIAQSGEIQLHGIVVVFGWQRIISDLAGLRVQAAERALVHRVEPDLPGMVELDAQESGWGVFGLNLPMNISPKSVYQTLPSLSTRMSCGSVVGRNISYSVTIARVSLPFGRGSLLSSYVQWSAELRFIVAR